MANYTYTTVAGNVRAILNAAISTIDDSNITADETNDQSPHTFPYITIQEGIGEARNPNAARDYETHEELVQVDLYQKRSEVAEDVTLVAQIIRALNNNTGINPLGANGENGVMFRCRFFSKVHRYERDTQIVNDTITFAVPKRY